MVSNGQATRCPATTIEKSKLGNVEEKYEKISTSYLDAYLAGKIGTGECQ